MGKLLWCTLFWESSLLGKQAEEKHSIGGCCCGEMQLSGNAADWGTGECTAVEISAAQILQSRPTCWGIG